MPKQKGTKITGTLRDFDLTFYKQNGQYLVKNKSSLNAKRISKDPSFRVFRERSTQFAEAAKIAKTIYRLYPIKRKKAGVFSKLSGKVYKYILEGKTEEEIRKLIK